MIRAALFALAFSLALCVQAATLTPQAQAEIAGLLDHLAASGCEFYRNGSWHSATEARAHLQKKYDYLVRKQLIASAEEFIERGASESSMSGEAYQVRCAGSEPVPSAQWLKAALKQQRDAR